MFSSNINDDEIKKRIIEFRKRARNGIADKDCLIELSRIFGDEHSFPAETIQFEKKTIFYRARAIPNDNTILRNTINNIADAWEPPSHIISSQGRLNAVNQSILYCCLNHPSLAIDEARARSSKHVAIMVYKSTRPIKAATIGNYHNSNLPKDNRTERFYSFLDEEFSRIASTNEEGIYSISRTIADTYFNYPEQDAWCYRSVMSPERFNIAFLPEKHKDCLELQGVMICDTSKSSDTNLSVIYVVDFDKNTHEARYHLIGSAEQKRIFPEITTNEN